MNTSGKDRLDTWVEAAEFEAALDPDLPIIDPHHHLWDRGGHRYLAAELQADLDCGHKFIATAYVECLSHYRTDGPVDLRPVGETEFVVSTLPEPLATRYGPVRAAAAIIARADLSLGNAVDRVLDEHALHAGGRLRGIRYATSWHEGDAIRSHYPTVAGMLRLPEVHAGINRLAAHELTFDIWGYFTQLPDMAAAADTCPNTMFIIGHCGGPLGIGPWAENREEMFRIWRDGVSELARRSNVAMKLGGLGMPPTGFAFHKRPSPPSSDELAEAWRPYVLHCIEKFGADRCMFESNWPVDRTAGRYGSVWNAFKKISRNLSLQEREALFAGTAARIYRI